MASINLDEIQTKPTITASDTLNIEVIQGKFDLSYKTDISKMNGFFMSNTQMDNYKKVVSDWVVGLERWVFGDGVDYLGFATKDMLDNNYLYLSESNYYYKRLLTDEVMEALCDKYATKDMVSASVEYCKMKGQYAATELANLLAQLAAVMKTQAIKNDTNVQTTYIKAATIVEAGATIGEGAAALYQALLDALAAANGGHDMTYANLSEAGKSAIKQLCLNKTNHPNPWGKDCPVKCWLCSDVRANPGDLREHVCKSHKDDPEIAAIISGG